MTKSGGVFKMILGLVFLGFAPFELVTGQCVQSPCPRQFVYEPSKARPDRWYGILTLLNEDQLNGVWIRLIFDKIFLELGVYWDGEIKTDDHKTYLLKNPNFTLKASTPQSFRIYARYDPAETPPQFLGYRLNAKTVCPAPDEVEVTESKLITSDILDTTSSNQNTPVENIPILGSKLAPVACGTVAVQARPLLTQGVPADEGSFPWHVALYEIYYPDLKYICGGSLISENHVITAGHCVTKPDTGLLKSVKTLQVYLGKYLLTDWSSPHIQVRHLSKILRHPHYDRVTHANDVAVLKLVEPVIYTNYIRPLCLWQESEDINPLEGKLGVVVGWGLDETGNESEKLTMTRMPVVAKEKCIYSNPDLFVKIAGYGTYCAGYAKEGTTVACKGDSGGAMIFPVKGNPKAWQLRGIVSQSAFFFFGCPNDNYIIFTDVAKYSRFLRDALSL